MTALFAAAVFASARLHVHEHQGRAGAGRGSGVLFALTKAPQYANLDYLDAYGDAARPRRSASFPEDRSALCRQRPVRAQPGHRRRRSCKPWGERSRSAQQLKPLMQQKVGAVEGMNAFVFSLPPLPASIGGLPVQMVIDSTGDFDDDLSGDGQDQGRQRARAGCSWSPTAISTSTSRRSRSISTAARPTTSGITMQAIGDTLALLVGENYVNRFNLDGRSYQVIPQVPRVDRLTPETLTQYYVTSAVGPAGAAVEPRSALKTVTAAQCADPVQPAQFRHLPGGADARRDDGPGGRFPRKAGARTCRPGSATTTCPDARQYVREGNQLVDHLRFRADRDLSGAGGAVREPARSAGDPRQRADVDVRRADAAVLRPGDDEHLHPGRARDPDRADQQARHPDGRIRQPAAARARASTGARAIERAARGPAAPDPDDDGGDGRSGSCRC